LLKTGDGDSGILMGAAALREWDAFIKSTLQMLYEKRRRAVFFISTMAFSTIKITDR
jgi:hypothetical protein